ncbi:uncharacterized protein ACBT44_008052 [Syngnathus typhle]
MRPGTLLAKRKPPNGRGLVRKRNLDFPEKTDFVPFQKCPSQVVQESVQLPNRQLKDRHGALVEVLFHMRQKHISPYHSRTASPRCLGEIDTSFKKEESDTDAYRLVQTEAPFVPRAAASPR